MMSRNDELIEAFATELKVRRNKLGISQDKLAGLANVNRTYIAKLEQRKNQPSLSVLHDLAIALNNNLPELIEGIVQRYNENLSRRRASSLLNKADVPKKISEPHHTKGHKS